jgi:stress response protein YsnF
VTSPTGIPAQDWHEEPTGVHTDAQVFRAVKKLGEELEANKREAAKAHGALKQEVAELAKSVDTRLTKQDLVLERMAGQMDVLVPIKRSRSDSSETRAIAADVVAKSTMQFRRDVVLKIVTGLFSAGVLGAFIHWVAS